MIRCFFVLLTLLGLAGIGWASSCAVRHRVVVAKPAVVVKETVAVVPAVLPVAVYAQVAAYGAVYTPPTVPVAPAVTAPASGPSTDLTAVLKALEAIDARLRKLEGSPAPAPAPSGGGGGTPPAAPTPATKQPAAFQTKCAACHESKVAAEKGGGLTLLEGATLARLSDRQKFKVATTAYSGRMPPRSSGIAPLTDAEVAEIVSYLDALK